MFLNKDFNIIKICLIVLYFLKIIKFDEVLAVKINVNKYTVKMKILHFKKYLTAREKFYCLDFVIMENYPIITEKLYRILQIYLSNKGQASIELVNLISSDNISINFLQ